MGRTNIDLDQHLIVKVMKLTGALTKKAAVHRALEDMVNRETRKGILSLEGKVSWSGNLSQMRKVRFDSRRYKRLDRLSGR